MAPSFGDGRDVAHSEAPPEGVPNLSILARAWILGGSLETWYDDGALTLAAYHNLLVVMWHDRPATLVHAHVSLTALDQMARRSARGFAMLVVINRGAKPGGPQFERLIVQGIRRRAHRIRASAMLVEEGGFAAAVFRGVMSVVQRWLEGAFPSRIFRDVWEAAGWLRDRMRGTSIEPVTAPAVCSVVASLRESHAQRA